MLVNGIVSVIEGENYRVTIKGIQSGAVKKLAHVYTPEVDFSNRTITKKPPQIGDKVLVYFEGNGYSGGYILGLEE